jgi:zinc protease
MVSKVQLKNGMTVLKNLQTKSPVVSLQVWVDNGSANETPEVAGVSHFIEHLLFKGTKSFGPGEIAQYIEGAGGQLNAYTSFDQTVYYMTLGASKIEVGLKALSEMIFFPLFQSVEVDREREVVIEEIRRGLDEPSRVNSQFTFKSFFKNHPYGRPIIGYDTIIENISVEEIKKFFYEKYHPERTFLMITGDFDEKEIDQKIIEYFDIKSNVKPYEDQQIALPDLQKKEFEYQRTSFEESVFNFYWPSAELNSKEYICLELLALILGQGESSLLYQALKLENPVVKTIGGYAYSLKQPGVFAINFKPMMGKEIESLNVFLKELKSICSKGLSSSDFEKAIINFKSEIFYSMETCDGLARHIGQNYFYLKDENYVEKYLELLDAININDVENVFQKYILDVPPKLYISMNKDDDYIEAVEKIFKNEFNIGLKLNKHKEISKKANLTWKPKALGKNTISEFKLDNGARLYIKPQNETPVIQMDMAFLGGEKIDSMNGVLALLTQKCWGRETARMNEAELMFEFDRMASSHSVFTGKHSLGFQISTLSPYFKNIVDLNFALMQQKNISQKIIDRDHVFLKQYFENRKDNPVQMAFQEFMNQMFQGHYYQNDALKSISEMDSVQSDKVASFIQSHFDPNNLVISIVGDVDIDSTMSLIEDGLNTLKLQKQKINFTPFLGLKENKFKEINLDKEQAQILFGFEGLRFDDPRRPTLSVIQSILSGQGGRLFIELRDKASLAYTVSPIRMEGQESGYFGSYIACAPAKKNKAIQMMKDEFEKLITTPVGLVELEAAKASLIGRAEIALQRNSEISEKILFDAVYGQPFDSYLKYSQQIKSVTSEEIMQLMSELYAQPQVLVTLG